jgi:hypothetical protein
MERNIFSKIFVDRVIFCIQEEDKSFSGTLPWLVIWLMYSVVAVVFCSEDPQARHKINARNQISLGDELS